MIDASIAADVCLNKTGSRLLLLCRFKALAMAPVPRCDESALPDSDLGPRSVVFLSDVISGIPTIGYRIPLSHHPSVQVFTTGTADSDDPVVPVYIFLLALDRAVADLPGKGNRGIPSTA